MLLSIGGGCFQSVFISGRSCLSVIQWLLRDWVRLQVLLWVAELLARVLFHLVKLAAHQFEMRCSVQVLTEASHFQHTHSLALRQAGRRVLDCGLLRLTHLAAQVSRGEVEVLLPLRVR